MGNIAGTETARASALSEKEIKSKFKLDSEYSLLESQIWDPTYISAMKEIDSYEVPGSQTSCPEGKIKNAELIAACMTDKAGATCLDNLKSELSKQIAYISGQVDDSQNQDVIRRLKSVYRIHEALVRQDEREKRRENASANTEEKKVTKKKQKEMPVYMKVAIQFIVGSLLNMFQSAGGRDPLLYNNLMDLATNILGQLDPLSLVVDDETVSRSIEDVGAFFGQILAGQIKGVTEKDQIAALSPILGLALAKGNLTSALSISQRFLTLKNSNDFQTAVAKLKPMLKQLSQILGPGASRMFVNWNADKLGPEIALSNENLTVTRTTSSAWGCQLSEQSFTSGIHYIEISMDRNDSTCLLIGVGAPQFSAFTDKASGQHCYTLQSDGDMYCNGSSSKVFAYNQGDRLGMLINMEEHKLFYFKNGTKQECEGFTIPEEVHLMICFGGSNQFMTIQNEPDVPEEALEMIGQFQPAPKMMTEEEKKNAEVEEESKEAVPKDPAEILKNSKFDCINEESGTITPVIASVYVLLCLENISGQYFKNFQLDQEQSQEEITGNIAKKLGFSVDVQQATFNYLCGILTTTVEVYSRKQWDKIDSKLCTWAIISALRLLKSHLFTVHHLRIPEEEAGLTPELKDGIYKTITKILEISEVTPEHEAILKEASLTLIHSYKIFYSSTEQTLAFLRERVQDAKNQRPLLRSISSMYDMITLKLISPVSLSKAFEIEDEAGAFKVQSILVELLEQMDKASSAKLRGGEEPPEHLMKFLQNAQKVMLSQSARNGFSGHWQTILQNYVLKALASGSILIKTLEPTAVVDGTILDKVLPNLLLPLCLCKFALPMMTSLLKPIMSFSQLVTGLKLTSTGIRQTRNVSQILESEHPYANGSNTTEIIRISGATKYKLTFDPQCNTEATYDYLEIFTDEAKTNSVGKYEGTNWPTEPKTIDSDLLVFSFVSDDSTNQWGYKVTVETEVSEMTGIQWLSNLRESVNCLVSVLNSTMIQSNFVKPSDDSEEALNNPLLKHGVKDKALWLITPNKERSLPDELVKIALFTPSSSSAAKEPAPAFGKAISSLEGISPAFGRSISKFVNATNASGSLGSYMTAFTANTRSFGKYSESTTLEELVTGSDRVLNAMISMKKKIGIVGPMAAIGGAALDQAERAIMAVYISAFDQSELLSGLLDNPKSIDSSTSKILKQACAIRKWAQEEKSRRIDAGEEGVTMQDIGHEIVKKCVLLLHSRLRMAIDDMEIKTIYSGVSPGFQRAASEEGKGSTMLKKGSMWKTVKKQIASLQKLQTLLQFMPKKRSTVGQIESEDSELSRLHSVIMSFVGSSTKAEKLVEQLHHRRIMGICRTLGLQFLLNMLKSNLAESKNIRGLIINVFSDGLKSDGKKVHYTNGIQGIDPNLTACVQIGFFQIYQFLLNRLKIPIVKELDCTNKETTKSFLSSFEALSYPFDKQDTHKLLDLNLSESISFLLSWAKGLYINEKIPMQFVQADKVITSFSVHNEDEFMNDGSKQVMSLNLTDRLAGDLDEDSGENENEQEVTKLCLEICKDKKELPIVEIKLLSDGEAAVEGWEKVEAKVNETGPDRYLAYRRAEPAANLNFLTGIKVTSNNPLTLEGKWTPYNDLLEQNQTKEEQTARNERRDKLKLSAWNLFKTLVYSCVGKTEDKLVSGAQESKQMQLQEVFLEQIFQELTWYQSKEKIVKETQMVTNIQMSKVSSGVLWLGKATQVIENTKNPVSVWLSKFRAEYELERESWENEEEEEDELTKMIDFFISKFDPTMKGKLTPGEIEQLDEETKNGIADIPDTAKNSEGEIDFFCFLKTIKEQEGVPAKVKDYMSRSPLWQNLPTDCYTAAKALELSPSNAVAHLRASVPEESTFRKYVTWMADLGNAKMPGILDSEKFPEAIPKEFLNSKKDFDLFVTLNYIKHHPEDKRWEDVQDVVKEMNIETSCEEIYSKLSSNKASPDYMASLLWVINQCCVSASLLKVLSRPKILTELIKHMLMGANDAIQVTAFRIVRRIIEFHHSPMSFAPVWSAVPKEALGMFLPASSLENIVTTMLAFVSLQFNYYMRRDIIMDQGKIAMLCHEATELLRSLFSNERWADEIINEVQAGAQDISSKIVRGSEDMTIGFGTLGFLISSMPNNDTVHHQEWTQVTLKDGQVSDGYVIKIFPNKTARIYNSEDEMMHNDNVDKISGIKSQYTVNVFSHLNMASHSQLLESLIQSARRIEETKVDAETVDGLHIKVTIYNAIKKMIYQVLQALVSCDFPIPQDLLSQIFSRIQTVEAMDAKNSHFDSVARNALYTRHRDLALELLEKQGVRFEEDPEAELKEQKAQAKKISEMNEDLQVAVASAMSMGHSFHVVNGAVDYGHKELDHILGHIEERKEESKKEQAESNRTVVSACLFKLAKSDGFKFYQRDSSGKANFMQNSKGHLVITSSDKLDEIKRCYFKPESKWLRPMKSLSQDITILATIGTSQKSATFGFYIGNFELKINHGKLNIENQLITSIDHARFSFKLVVKWTGEISVSDEDGRAFSRSYTSEGVFDGLKIAKMGVFVESSDEYPVSVSMKGCTIYSGAMQEKVSYWTEAADESGMLSSDALGHGKVRVAVKPPNMTAQRLGLTGATPQLCQEIAANNAEFDAALRGLFDHSSSWPGKAELPEDITISEIVIVDSPDDLDTGFEPVKVFDEGLEIGSWGDFIHQKVLAVKREKAPKNCLAGLEFNLNEEKKGYSEIGTICDVKLFSNVISKQQMGKRLPLKDIILVRAYKPMQISLPIGYELFSADDVAIDFAPRNSKFSLWLAYRSEEIMLNWPINKLSSRVTTSGAFGLVDDFEKNNTEAEFDPKDVEEETATLRKTSIPELLYLIGKYEKSSNQEVLKKLFVSVLRRNPEKLTEIINQDNFYQLMNCLSDDLDILTQPFKTILATPRGQNLSSMLFGECVFQLIMASTVGAQAGKMKEQVFESAHPYENNANLEECIQIKGATSLNIVFDPETKTESGCDNLRFYNGPNRTGQIVEYSGSNFAALDIPGDTVYYTFTTDSSCVEWGYRFTVFPVGGKSNAIQDPMAKKANIKHALWILDFLLSYETLPASLTLFSSKYVINPLAVYMYKVDSEQSQKKLMSLLQELLSRPSSVSQAMRGLAEALTTEARDVFETEKPQKAASGLLQSLINLVVEAKDKYGLVLDDEWFTDISDVYSMMVGLGNRSDELLPMLFEQFKTNHKVTTEIHRESSHPYSKRFSTKEVYYKGADYLDICFTEESKAEPCESILFTYDKARTQTAEGDAAMANKAGGWALSPTGPDIAISNNNLTITRTNSSSWGNAIWGDVLTKTKMKITMHIDNDGDSNYLYIGVMKAGGDYDLANVLNSDYSRDLWTYKRPGEFHKKGNNDTINGSGYNTGDTIEFDIDLFEMTMTCFKNGTEHYKFTDLAEEVIPCICFGGSNQWVTITKIEASGGIALSNKSIKIKGDRVFYSYPVNIGYLTRNSNMWKKDSSDWVSITNDCHKVKRITDKSGPTVHYSELPIECGRHYYEVSFGRLAPGAKVQVGFAPAEASSEEFLVHDNTACIQNDGLAFVNCAQKRYPGKIEIDDTVGCYLDKEGQTVKFFVNDREVVQSAFNFDASVPYFLVAVLSAQNQECIVNDDVDPPSTLDLIGEKSKVVCNASEYGYKFKITPIYRGANALNAVANLNERQQDKWTKYIQKHQQQFNQEIDEQLVTYIDEFCLSKSLNPLTMDSEELKPKPEELVHYPKLEKIHVQDIKDRFRFLVSVNKQIDKVLHLLSLDLSTRSKTGLTGIKAALLKVRFAIFFEMKNSKFTEIVTSTNKDTRPEIKIQRAKAALLKNKGKVDTNGTLSVFGQIYQHLKATPPKSLRDSERIFQVNFQGEGAQDAGGPYNEVMSIICDELQSKYLSLFVPCQNSVHNIGENRDSWIMNTSADNSIAKELFLFLGKIMGVAIRTQNNLNLSMPPIFWKRVVMEEPNLNDLKSMDECCFQMVEIMKNLEAQGIGEEEFKEMFSEETFTTTDSGGRTVDLVEDGSNKYVTFENAAQYANAIVSKRLSECEDQYALIRKGMSAVVPIQLLSLFTWRQVETKICGTQDINVDILMENTEYSGIDSNARHVKFFWEVLREITPKDRSLFLRFVWGRSRLPSGKNFKKFKLTALNKGGNEDGYLPVSHTCFFQLDLPSYSTKDVMKEKLLYAITHCQAIDLDHVTSETFDDSE